MWLAFDNNEHEYLDVATGIVLPHITGLLERDGWIDSEWYTEESCVRGSEVHRWTAAYDLGAIRVHEQETSGYKGWFQAHVKAMSIVQPVWQNIEKPRAHDRFRYGGRPDRDGLVYNALSVVEIKSGDFEKAHLIQTALQAILVAQDTAVPAEHINRYGLYLKPNGKFKLEQFVERRDFDEAYRIIYKYCEVAA